jgi:hypothetical protein
MKLAQSSLNPSNYVDKVNDGVANDESRRAKSLNGEE